MAFNCSNKLYQGCWSWTVYEVLFNTCRFMALSCLWKKIISMETQDYWMAKSSPCADKPYLGQTGLALSSWWFRSYCPTLSEVAADPWKFPYLPSAAIYQPQARSWWQPFCVLRPKHNTGSSTTSNYIFSLDCHMFIWHECKFCSFVHCHKPLITSMHKLHNNYGCTMHVIWVLISVIRAWPQL